VLEKGKIALSMVTDEESAKSVMITSGEKRAFRVHFHDVSPSLGPQRQRAKDLIEHSHVADEKERFKIKSRSTSHYFETDLLPDEFGQALGAVGCDEPPIECVTAFARLMETL
jgi:hypothetical protein